MNKFLKLWIDQNELKPLFHSNHPKPQTRREFLAQGFLAYSASIAFPSFLSRPLFADPCEGSGTVTYIPFLIFDCAGGAALPANFLVGGKGGPEDYLKKYTQLGWDPSESGSLDKQFGLPMSAKYSTLLTGINQTASAEARANLRMGSICHQARADSSANQLSAAALLYRLGYGGSLVRRYTGNRSSLSGGNSDVALPVNGISALFVNSLSDLNSAVGFESTSPLGKVKSERIRALLNVGRNIGRKQMEPYLGEASGDLLSKLSDCAYYENEKILATSSTIMDPRTDANFQGPYQINANSDPKSQAVVFAALTRGALNGFTGPSTMTFSGCDYHDQTATTGAAKDLEIGQYIGRAVQAAHLLKKPVFFQIITDGGCRNVPGTRVWTSDAVETCMTIMGYYRPEGPPAQKRLQVGYYTDGQAAAPDALSGLGENPFKVACAVFANYLALHVPQDKFLTESRRYIPTGTFKDDDELLSTLVFG